MYIKHYLYNELFKYVKSKQLKGRVACFFISMKLFKMEVALLGELDT